MRSRKIRVDAPRLHAAFSLVELMVVLAIAAFLAGIAVPSFVRIVRSVRLSGATNDLLGAMLFARSEAIKRNSRVALCKSRDGETCFIDGEWDQGWIVFHDANGNAGRDSGEAVLNRHESLSSSIRAWGNASVERYMSYSATGESRLVSGGFQAGTFTLCSRNVAGEARQIVISRGGRPRVARATLASC